MPCDPSEGAPSPAPSEAPIEVHGSATARFGGIDHRKVEVPWAVFCAKLTALADRVPSGKSPVVVLTASSITVTWRE